jgi:hypothetical protein|tara:strand:- start:3629 stop:4114 length:486 start_codon:yes stop_codon:yes gene_type:complete
LSNVEIRLLKSDSAGKIPLVGDLAYGELAINYKDGRLFYKNADNVVKFFTDSDAIKAQIDSAQLGTLLTSGGTMTGQINMSNLKIVNVSSPSDNNDAVNKIYVDNAITTGVGAVSFPEGNYGTVDSAGQIDAFGISTGGTFECMDPVGSLATIDLGVDSSV